MAHVRGHYRNGRYVRPHTRRTKHAGTTSARTAAQPRRVQSQSSHTSPTTRVRGHYRNGFYVRPHERRIGPRAGGAAGGFGLVVAVLLILAYLNGGVPGTAGSQPPEPASQTTDSHP